MKQAGRAAGATGWLVKPFDPAKLIEVIGKVDPLNAAAHRDTTRSTTMGEMTTRRRRASSAGIDLSQFYQVFFEEAGENLDTMEQQLLELDIDRGRRRGAERDLPLRALGQGRRGDLRLCRRGRADAPDGDAARQAAPPRARADRRDGRRAAASGDALRAQLARHQGAGGDADRHHRAAARASARWSAGERRRAAPQLPRRAPSAAAPVAAPARPARAEPTPRASSSCGRPA